MGLDPARFPRAAEYVESLPQGLESFSTCAARSTVFEPHVRDFSSLSGEPGLPQQVSNLLSGRLSAERWVPEVVFQTACLVVRDLAFEDDAALHRWIFTTSQEMFEKPLLRTLMKLVSPNLTVLGAAKRWSAFHQGTEAFPGTLKTVDARMQTSMDLRYPPGLFPHLFLVGIEQAFAAAIIAARARDATVGLDSVEPGHARFVASWLR